MLICSQYNSREGTEHDMPPHEYESTNVSISDPLTSYNLYSALFIYRQFNLHLMNIAWIMNTWDRGDWLVVLQRKRSIDDLPWAFPDTKLGAKMF